MKQENCNLWPDCKCDKQCEIQSKVQQSSLRSHWHPLRKLAYEIRDMAKEHPSWSQAAPVVEPCVDHLCAIAGMLDSHKEADKLRADSYEKGQANSEFLKLLIVTNVMWAAVMVISLVWLIGK